MVGWHHPLKDMSLSKLWDVVKDREAMMLKRVEHD